MATTMQDLTTVFTQTLTPVTTLQNSDFSSANPLDVSVAPIASTATAKTVVAGTIGAVTVTPFSGVSYTQITTADEINNESLNRTAETLKVSINSQLTGFANGLNTTLANLRSDTANAFTTLTTDINGKLASLKDEANTQVSAINTKIAEVVTGFDASLSTIRTAEAQQSLDISNKVNLVAGELLANIAKVKLIADNAQAKIASLDDVYGTDADIASKVTNVNDFINTLRDTDLDFIKAIDGTIDEVNSLRRISAKEVIVSAGNGIYSFVCLAEGFGEFLSVSDYSVVVDIVGNYKAQVAIENKTKDGFDLRVTSNGVHFVPQPVDCSVTPVKLSIEVTYNKKDPLTFNVDTLNGSFLSGGTGTDANGVGAMVLSAFTAALAPGANKNINILGGSGTITTVSSNTGIATASVTGTVLTIHAVAAGTATIVVSDANTTRTVAVTVA